VAQPTEPVDQVLPELPVFRLARSVQLVLVKLGRRGMTALPGFRLPVALRPQLVHLLLVGLDLPRLGS
jgi:hypothetical protein